MCKVVRHSHIIVYMQICKKEQKGKEELTNLHFNFWFNKESRISGDKMI